jgi:glucose 1-dehydrogenase
MRYSGIENKVAIVTGAGEGIGYAIVTLLLEAGACVILNDITEDMAIKAVAALEKSYAGKCVAHVGDAGEIPVINEMVDLAIRHFGKIDFVIPNAGITLFGDFFEFTPEDFQKVMQLNLLGAFFLIQRAASEMRSRGQGGRVVLMSSITGIKSYPSLAAYSMTKAALQMLAKSLVLVLSPLGITINAIAPGATLTERTAMEEPDYAGAWARLLPAGTVGKPEDMAHMCLFLLSDEAAHITGQTLVVDGGWTVIGRYPGDLG